MIWLIDFETRSDLDLPSVGTERYLHTTNSDIVCMSWWNPQHHTAKIWLPGLEFPIKSIGPKDRVYAFNIQFDERVWNYIGTEKYGFPFLPLDNCIDVMALCGRYGLPQKLSDVGKALNLRVQKMPIANKLMKKICSPPFEYTQAEFKEFLRYCIDDTNTMRELLFTLPAQYLDPYIEKVWRTVVKINRTGLPIDIGSVAMINARVRAAKEQAHKELAAFTDGVITTADQVQRIKQWARDYGVEMPDISASTVVEYLSKDIPPEVRYVLEVRSKFGKAAVSKYSTLLSNVYKGRIYDNLRFFGGHTMRCAGLGFQAHNLYRGDKKVDMDAEIERIRNVTTPDIIGSARDCVRGMIKAPEGKILYIGDYKSIENVLLAFVAGEVRTLNLYREGKDEYRDFATGWFNIKYEDVTKDQRSFCKPPVLGCGYGLGPGTLIGYAEGYGVDLEYDTAQQMVNLWRSQHPMVVRFWYKVSAAVTAAIKYKGQTFSYLSISCKVVKDRKGTEWLTIELPDGRKMFYYQPEIRKGKYDNLSPHYLTWVKNRMQWKELTPGLTTENIIQSLGASILFHGKMKLLDAGFMVILSVHDEVLIELNKDKIWSREVETEKRIHQLACDLPFWAKGLPLSMEGEFSERYKKI